MKYFYCKRESIVFVLFLFVNILLSINCFATMYVDKKTKINTVYETTNKAQSRLFLKIKEIKLDSNHPYIIRFKIEGIEDRCLYLSEDKKVNAYVKEYIVLCKSVESVESIASKWMIDYTERQSESFLYTFPISKKLIYKPDSPNEILLITKGNYYSDDLRFFKIQPDMKEMKYTGKYSISSSSFEEKEELKLDEKTPIDYQFNCLLYVKSGTTKKPYLLLFKNHNQKRFTTISLNWDIEYMEDTEAKTVKKFWTYMYLVAFLFDLLTLPFQMFGFILDGYK